MNSIASRIKLAFELIRGRRPDLELREALNDLLFVINEDDEGEYFICSEAKPIIERARLLAERLDNE
jgi:hypothetical protein